jgi:hypothetical protein
MRKLVALLTAAALALTTALPAAAGSPHFVGDPVFTVSGNTVTVSAKEAGLGDEDQIVVVLSGDAACINPGGKKPQAGNKEAFSSTATIPVQNGKATYTLSLSATFTPDCTPPMSVVWSGLVLTDTTSGISATP